jgi:hypothetical protein
MFYYTVTYNYHRKLVNTTKVGFLTFSIVTFGLSNSLMWALPGIVGCIAVSWLLPIRNEAHSPLFDKQKCFQILANVHRGVKLPSAENHLVK